MKKTKFQPNPSQAAVRIVPGSLGPTYPEGSPIMLDHVAITEKGTEKDLPLVDFVMRDENGIEYVLVLTGRTVNAIAAAIKGINLRNHGTEEP